MRIFIATWCVERKKSLVLPLVTIKFKIQLSRFVKHFSPLRKFELVYLNTKNREEIVFGQMSEEGFKRFHPTHPPQSL